MRSTARTFAIGALSLAAAVVLVGCTGDDDPSPTGSSSVQPSESSAESMTRAELESAVFDEESGSSEVLGSAEGAVPDPLAPHPARIDVNAVIADETSTTVWFTLVNTEDTDPLLQFSAFNKLRPLSQGAQSVPV